MTDKSYSKKVGDEYKTMMSRKQGKYGMQFSFSPEFQKEFYDWIKSQDGTWFNMNEKEWGKPSESPDNPVELNDEIPF